VDRPQESMRERGGRHDAGSETGFSRSAPEIGSNGGGEKALITVQAALKGGGTVPGPWGEKARGTYSSEHVRTT